MRADSVRVLLLAAAALAALLVGATPAPADSWGPPRREPWSANERYVLKVRWPRAGQGEDGLSLWERTGEDLKDEGLKKVWGRDHADPHGPPHRAHVADDGRFVVLQDVHGRVGHGQVIVILGADGRLLGGHTLAEILPPEEVLHATTSTSSVWWQENGWFSFVEGPGGERWFALATREGTVRGFDLPTGRLLDLTEAQRTAVVDHARRDALLWIKGKDPQDRIRGVTLLGALGIRQAIPQVKRLFADQAVTGTVGREGRPPAEIHGVRAAAAHALVRLLGVEAIGLIEPEIREADWFMQVRLLEALLRLDTRRQGFAEEPARTPHAAEILRLWERLAESPSDEVRPVALTQVLRRDDGGYLLAHPGLVGHDQPGVRAATIELLGRMQAADAIPLLRRAARDEDGGHRFAALKALVAHDPPDLEAALRPHRDDASPWVRLVATAGLANQGDKEAQDRLRKTMRSWHDGDGDQKNARERGRQADVVCELVAELRLAGLREELERVRPKLSGRPRVLVTGALAALGDAGAFSALHRAAASEDLHERLTTLKMCGYLRDDASRRLLKEAAGDDDSAVALIAREALRQAGLPKESADDRAGEGNGTDEKRANETEAMRPALPHVVVRTVRPPGREPGDAAPYGLTRKDFDHIADALPNLRLAVPVREVRRRARAGDRTAEVLLVGTVPDYARLHEAPVARGRFLVSEDGKRLRNVAVLGESVARVLFPGRDPAGEVVRVEDDYFLVVGTTGARPRPARGGTAGGAAGDDVEGTGSHVYIPLATMRARLGDRNVVQRAGAFTVEHFELSRVELLLQSAADALKSAALVERLLDRLHGGEDFPSYKVTNPPDEPTRSRR